MTLELIAGEDILAIAGDLWASYLGDEPLPSVPGLILPEVSATVSVVGEWNGLVVVGTSARGARLVASVLLEIDESELSEGDGQEATAGSTVSVHYVGVAHSTGEEFDASYNRGAPLDFRLGVGQVISGWDQGVQGMKVGGRRRLVIPPHLGYGDRGAGGVIKPGETLIFVVDLVDVR